MKTVYKVFWTDHAFAELKTAFQYLELNFSEIEISRLAKKIESVLSYISKHPNLYPESFQKKGVRRAVVERFNTLYHRVNSDKNHIEILSFFANRDNPENLKL